MNDKEKLKLLEKLFFERNDLQASYRLTINVPDGYGLPSGTSGAEILNVLATRILLNESVTIV